jgi:predicted transcriptional regulator
MASTTIRITHDSKQRFDRIAGGRTQEATIAMLLDAWEMLSPEQRLELYERPQAERDREAAAAANDDTT